jgi:hypothetical protein
MEKHAKDNNKKQQKHIFFIWYLFVKFWNHFTYCMLHWKYLKAKKILMSRQNGMIKFFCRFF